MDVALLAFFFFGAQATASVSPSVGGGELPALRWPLPSRRPASIPKLGYVEPARAALRSSIAVYDAPVHRHVIGAVRGAVAVSAHVLTFHATVPVFVWRQGVLAAAAGVSSLVSTRRGLNPTEEDLLVLLGVL
jgi:hypothetical protein